MTVLLLTGGCASHPGAVASHGTAPPLACREVEGLEPLLAPGAGVLLGEIHGTTESPAFLANAACLALREDLPVTVALEIPREEQAAVDAYLASGGREADRAALLAGPFWTREYQDGRSSAAMVDLLDELRRLRGSGRQLRVALIDRAERPAKPAERDRWMAEALAQAFDATAGGVVIFLTGNVHSRVGRGTPWNPDYEPAGFVLASLRPSLRITSLDVVYPDGTAWTCNSAEASSCQVRELGGQGNGQDERVVLHSEITNGHNGIYHVKTLTASPPAVQAQTSSKN